MSRYLAPILLTLTLFLQPLHVHALQPLQPLQAMAAKPAPRCMAQSLPRPVVGAELAGDTMKMGPLGPNVSPTEVYTRKLYVRLTGATVPLLHPRFKRALSLVEAGKTTDATKIITSDKNFLRVRVRNFAAPFSSKELSNLEPFNDLQALIIGVTRDELDARFMLTGNLRYSGYPDLHLPAVSFDNNDHYTSFDAQGLDFDRDLQMVEVQWPQFDVAAGAFTTRAWARAHYNAGTNRRAFEYAFDVFLCQSKDNWKVRGLTDVYVRRDVDRAPSGNPWNYQNRCRNCHAPMDAMGGAFAKLDFANNTLAYVKDGVAAKMNQNSVTYPGGFVTSDDRWTNLMGEHPSIDFGWRGALEGKGIESFAKSLAHSFAFSQCMVTKVFRETCGKVIQESAPELLNELAKDFESNGYNMRYLFSKVASTNACIPHPTGRF